MIYRSFPRRLPAAVLVLVVLLTLISAGSSQSKLRAQGLFRDVSDVPNVDYRNLDADKRRSATRVMVAIPCRCDNKTSISECRRTKPNCAFSKALAMLVVTALDEPDPTKHFQKPQAKGPVDSPSAPAAQPLAPADDSIARVKLDLEGSPSVGPDGARVTLVEFLDYACGFCVRGHATVKELMERYPDDLRVVYQFTSFRGPLANRASLAAQRQGRFEDMHEKLMQNARNIQREDLLRYASELGLDRGTFERDLNSAAVTQAVNAGRSLAARIGVTATPYFFVNGRAIRGARPTAFISKLIDEELSGKLPKTRWLDKVEEPKRKSPARPKTDPNTIARIKIDLDGAPFIGPQDAPVTIVKFNDYECGFCSRAHKTVKQIIGKYGDKVRIVLKQNPLGFHKNAPLAARAALAADVQDSFEAMHDILMENAKALQRPQLISYARKIGLDVEGFEAALDSKEFKEIVDADIKFARQIGVTATPYFFVNGRTVRGAKPFPFFEKLIDEELSGKKLKPTRWVTRVEAEKPAGNAPCKNCGKVHGPGGHGSHAGHDHAQQGAGLAAEDRKLLTDILKLNKELSTELKTLRREVGTLRRNVRELKGQP